MQFLWNSAFTFFWRVMSLSCALIFIVLTLISLVAAQVPSPTGQLVNSVPLEQTPAEEESRKSISRSFKGTMASSTERRMLILFILLYFLFYFFLWVDVFPCICYSFCLLWSALILVFSPACEDVLTPVAVADSAVKVLNSCLATMPTGRQQIVLNIKMHGRSTCLNCDTNAACSKITFVLHKILNDKQSF